MGFNFISWWNNNSWAWVSLGIIIGVIVLVIYFLPSIIAWKRKHKNALAIFLLNLFLGLSGFGWVGALIWACMK